jgi:hypothetical protein
MLATFVQEEGAAVQASHLSTAVTAGAYPVAGEQRPRGAWRLGFTLNRLSAHACTTNGLIGGGP